MRIENLQYVLEVARAGSISAAAKNLWIGQTTLSAAIQAAEKELDIQLFLRTSRGITPTPRGKEAIRIIERILTDYQKLTEVSKKAVTQYASCNIGCYPAFCTRLGSYLTLEKESRFRDTSLPIIERVKDLLSRLTIEEKIHLLSTHQLPVERLGIGEWYVGQEVARGYVSREKTEPSTVFPQPIGLASTFDPNLMEQLGEIAGEEARYYHRKDPKGHLMLWGPTVDPERDPRWGRTEEGYGEDPFLIGEMTTAYTQGMAGDHPTYRRVIPTLKHFCANNNEKERNSCSSNVTPRTLREYYYRAFEASIVRGGTGSMMTAYNELNGVPACMNPDLKTLVKKQWGLEFIVTDGADFSQNVLAHHSHATHAEALAACLKNGNDVMTDEADMVAAAARDALDRGLLTEADIDRAVGNSLSGRFRLGEFDGDSCPYNTEPAETDTLLHRAVNRCAAMEQMCLLHNRGILPLQLQPDARVAVIGPLGNENYRDWYTGVSSYAVPILEGLRQQLGAENVLFDDGYSVVALQSVETGKYCTVSADKFSFRRLEVPAERFLCHRTHFPMT